MEIRTLPDRLIVYGAPWCGDCRRAQFVLDELGVTYEYIDIDQDDAARELVATLNHGFRSVPTIVFPDGSVLVEPSNRELRQKLITPPAS